MASAPEDQPLLLNPYYRRSLSNIAASSALAQESSLLPRRASTTSVAECREQHKLAPPSSLPHRDEGMGRSIELGDSRTPLLAVVDGVTQQCDYFQPELSAADAAACLQHGMVGSFLVHGAAELPMDDHDRDAIFGLSFKDEDGSIIDKVRMALPLLPPLACPCHGLALAATIGLALAATSMACCRSLPHHAITACRSSESTRRVPSSTSAISALTHSPAWCPSLPLPTRPLLEL